MAPFHLPPSTPLLLACAEGDLAAVKRIIEDEGGDVSAASIYYHVITHQDGEREIRGSTEGATPLFVAAFNGHEEVARYLVGKGADVSVRTAFGNAMHFGMTPLFGALIQTELVFDAQQRVASPLREKKTAIARLLLQMGANPSSLHKSKYPIWMMNVCNSNVTAISALINSGLNLKQRNSITGATLLHHWAANPLGILQESRTEEESPLVIVKLLVEKGADLSALDKNGFSPILRAANDFNKDTSGEDLSIFDYLLERDEIGREDKIHALELIGAVILSDHGDPQLYPKAFDYWRRAAHLRQLDDGAGPLLKTVLKRKSGLTAEWATPTELEQVIQIPSELLVQSFLVRLRIYSSKSWSVIKSIIDDFIRQFFPSRNRPRHSGQVLNILLAILETIVKVQKEEPVCWSTTVTLVEELVEILSKLKGDDSFLTAETIKNSLELIIGVEQLHHLDKINYKKEISKYSYTKTTTLLALFTKLAGHPEKLNENIKKHLDQLLELESSSALIEPTVLQMACNMYCTRADYDTIELILQCGGDPTTGNRYRNGALHLLLSHYCTNAEAHEKQVAIARLLLDKGAHLDQVNIDGKTAVDLWTEARNNTAGVLQLKRLPDWCYERIPKLKCLSSRIVRRFKIPITAETLPIALKKFAELH